MVGDGGVNRNTSSFIIPFDVPTIKDKKEEKRENCILQRASRAAALTHLVFSIWGSDQLVTAAELR